MAWRAMLAVLITGLCGAADASHLIEIQAGRSYMDNHGAATVFVEDTLGEHRFGGSALSWAPDFSAGWINGRDLPHYARNGYATGDDIWLVAGGARLRLGDDTNWYHALFFSFQPALHTGRTAALSSAYEFVSTVGWQGRRVSLQLRHISNGALHEPNRGETMALVGIALGP